FVGQPLQHATAVVDVAFSPDGKTLLTLGESQTAARLWDAATGQPLGSLTLPSKVDVAVFSPDGKAVLTGSGSAVTGEALLWTVGAGPAPTRLWRQFGEVLVVAFSSDGRTALTAGGDRRARLWDAA